MAINFSRPRYQQFVKKIKDLFALKDPLDVIPGNDLTVFGNVKHVTSPEYTMETIEHILHCVSPVGCVIIIPNVAAAVGRIIIIKDAIGLVGPNKIQIVAEDTVTIDGKATLSITQKYGSVTLYSDGLNFFEV